MRFPHFEEWTPTYFVVDKGGVLVCDRTNPAEAAALRVEQRILKGNLVAVVVSRKQGIPDAGQFA